MPHVLCWHPCYDVTLSISFFMIWYNTFFMISFYIIKVSRTTVHLIAVIFPVWSRLLKLSRWTCWLVGNFRKTVSVFVTPCVLLAPMCDTCVLLASLHVCFSSYCFCLLKLQLVCCVLVSLKYVRFTYSNLWDIMAL